MTSTTPDDRVSAQELRTLFLLESLDDEQLAWFVENGRRTRIPAGEYLTREGEPAECFYQLLTGTMVMTRRVGSVEVEVTRTDFRGAYGGATASWIKQADRPSIYVASVRAATDATFLAVPADEFAAFMHEHFPIAVHLLDGIAAGMRRTQERVGDQQRLQALGALSAGLTHELNNPASAAERAVDQLRTRVEHMRSKLDYLADGHIPADVLHELVNLQNEALALSETAPRRSAMERSDAEDELGDWLEEHDIQRGFDLAGIYVAAGLDVSWAEKVYRTLHADDRQTGFAWVAYSLETDSLMREITDSVQRISQLVGAAKNYSQLDRAPFQQTDLHEGLESTLVMLSAKLKGITVVRDYCDDLPLVPGYPAELNQVWTNLIDNAAQATGQGGTITLRTRVEDDHVLVSVGDDGPGVPKELRSRIFEPFFTTKPVGAGTGLGLDISYRVVTGKHGGDIQVLSEPGDTRFEVRLPLVEPTLEDAVRTGQVTDQA
ncbi:ATP-binding protein [Angustibacter sp. McL0619]|uniref:ATP-binding protein n=1 Tax=Angustibacter sp. McL0619 TaxID=3415676 RepID=UPI003CEEEBE2